MAKGLTVSIIIPTLNEEENLRRLLPQLSALQPVPQIIVSDGGSLDETLEIAQHSGATVVTGAKGRGPQLNLGAEKARGDLLLFLHADSTLAATSYQQLVRTMQQQRELDGGTFTFSLAESTGIMPRVYEFFVGLRCTFFSLPYGDQGFFCRRTVFENGYNFAPLVLMEDVEWWCRMKQDHRVVILKAPLITSARRFEERGYLRSGFRNLYTLIRYRLGVSPDKLAEKYYR